MAVGIAMNIVTDEKKALESVSKPIVNMWWDQTSKPRNAIENIAITIPF